MKGKNIVFIIIICITAFFSACNTKQTFNQETDMVTPTPAPTQAKQVKLIDSGPEKGGTLTLFTTTVDDFNPYMTKNRFVIHITSFIFESLFVQTEENKSEPWIVEDWKQSDFTDWSFTIKDKIKFHNGVELTSYDVRHTIRVLESSDTDFFNTEFIENIEAFNIITSRQFEIILKEPDKRLIAKLTFPILSQSIQNITRNTLYGSGPYVLDNYNIDETMITLNRNENWWFDEPPLIDSVVFKVFPENKMMDAFQNNEIDAAFIKNVDFTKYRYRTDVDYREYSDNEGNFLYVNPDGLFGQLNRQQALFGYVIYRIHEMNLGQVQYLIDYNKNPLSLEEFRNAMVQSGLTWDESRKTFTSNHRTLKKIVVLTPEKDMQKLHTANFLVNILEEAGIPAEIKTMNEQGVKNAIRSRSYDLSPITEVLRPWEELADTIERMQESIGYAGSNSYILPLYRNQQATLFHEKIRGEKRSTYWNPYQAVHGWYITEYKDRSGK